MARWHIAEINSSSIRVWLEVHQIPAPAAYPGISQPDWSTIAVLEEMDQSKATRGSLRCCISYLCKTPSVAIMVVQPVESHAASFVSFPCTCLHVYECKQRIAKKPQSRWRRQGPGPGPRELAEFEENQLGLAGLPWYLYIYWHSIKLRKMARLGKSKASMAGNW